MAKAVAKRAEQHATRKTLEVLIKEKSGFDSAVGREREAWGQSISNACDNAHVDKFAFGVVYKLAKMDPARAAHRIRALTIYIDHLGLAAQTDIEDSIDTGEADDESAKDSGGVSTEQKQNGNGTLKATLSRASQSALARFTKAAAEAETVDAVGRGLQRFVKDYPDLEAAANEVAENRISQLPPAEPKTRRRPKLPTAETVKRIADRAGAKAH